MTILPRWGKRPIILAADNSDGAGPKGPWGGGGSGDGEGPRNPWSLPPAGRRGASKPTALDEFLKKARGSGGGNGGGGGFPGLPTGANPRVLWAIGTALLVGAWLVLTSFHQIGPQQRGIVTYFGRYAGTLLPGIQLTPPAPIARVQTVDVQRFRTENFPRGEGVNLTLTGDQNIVDLTYSVRWNIQNPRDYVFQLAQPEETVRAAAESAMRAVIATTTLDQALGAGRTTIEQRVAETTQNILNSYRSGVRIQGVSINRAAAPQQIVDDFNKVTAAQQEAVGAVNKARSYAQQVVAGAQGEAAAFDRVYEQYRLAPEVTRRRMYYETMEAVLAKSDKTIVEPQNVVPYLPLPTAKRAPDPEVNAAAAQPAQQAGGGQ
ncbi:protease modulator HflK [Sphingomonas sp. KR1UV-12]|uniref:Protease modulator HflK n=1 Tax=Sphingomonas aurea TaxID=3063994 RepID=A0ABT9EMU8_9SPHN|nr:protease modulator HflK [Sphingomonas sp. KR1UV-12]MDP1028290.1 protease modulator HflK [Sphingomonas sp. KR1UV-12]